MTTEGTPGSEPPRERRGVAGAPWAWVIGLIVIAGIIFWIIWAAWGDGDEVLVVPQQPAAVDVEEGDTVRVTGTVREFEFGEGLGEEDDFVDFEDDNVIVADSVEEVADGGAEGQDVLDEISDGDDDLVGQQVTVVGEVEEDDVGIASFTISETDE